MSTLEATQEIYTPAYWTPARIVALREAKSWSRQKMAAVFFCSERSVERWEAGDVKILPRTARDLALLALEDGAIGKAVASA